MQTRILIVFMFVVTGLCFAKAPDSLWSQTYGVGGEVEFSSVLQTADGGYISAGTSNRTFWLLKTNSTGAPVWNHTYGVLGLDVYCNSVQPTSDGGYILAGKSANAPEQRSDFKLVKTDSEGNWEWSRSYGRGMYEYANSVLQTDDGGYILAGSSWDSNSGGSDFWVVRTDPQGNEEWCRTYGGVHSDHCNCIQKTSDGGYVLAGSTEVETHQWFIQCFALIKINSTGDTLWTRTYSEWSINSCSSVKQTQDGGYILAGMTYQDMEFTRGLLIKTDADGNQQWSRHFMNEGDYSHNSVLQTSDGGFVMAGSQTYPSQFWMTKTTANGDSLWTCAFGGGAYQLCSSMQQTSDGGFILAGHIRLFNSDSSFAKLVKTTPDPMAADPEFILLPSDFSLACYPNPFNPSTTIRYSVPRMMDVNLDVFDITGRKVESLYSGIVQPGEHHIPFNGSALPSGMYFSRLQAEGQSVQNKMLLLK